MIINLDNLWAGLAWFREKWGPNILNAEYHEIDNRRVVILEKGDEVRNGLYVDAVQVKLTNSYNHYFRARLFST
jgi:hypothetical protein